MAYLVIVLSACSLAAAASESSPLESDQANETETTGGNGSMFEAVTRDTKVQEVIDNPVFEDYGRVLFPMDREIDEDLTLEDAGDILVLYNDINPDKTVEIVNYLGEQAASGNQIFYDIYTEEEKAEDPDKEDTGLLFFRGEP